MEYMTQRRKAKESVREFSRPERSRKGRDQSNRSRPARERTQAELRERRNAAWHRRNDAESAHSDAACRRRQIQMGEVPVGLKRCPSNTTRPLSSPAGGFS